MHHFTSEIKNNDTVRGALNNGHVYNGKCPLKEVPMSAIGRSPVHYKDNVQQCVIL